MKNQSELKIISPDYEIKLVIVGNLSVGKTSLLLRYADDKFIQNYQPTLGVDFKFKNIEVKDQKIAKIQIWDTAGQEKFRSMTSQFYKGANGIIIVYDITNKDSFEEVKNYWSKHISECLDKKELEIMILGNKADLNDQKEVLFHDLKVYSESKNFSYYECSALTSQSVNIAFEQFVNKIIQAQAAHIKTTSTITFPIQDQKQHFKNTCKC